MKLYLSSLGIPNAKAYRKLFSIKQARVAIIPTACNGSPKQPQYIQARLQEFADMGFTASTLDLAEYGGKKDEFAAKITEYDGVWILGGNTFYLNYWLRESGLDALLPDLFGRGFVYGGESAGAVAAGKTLHGIEVLDNPAEAPETLWSGLGLVDYGIIPHWGNKNSYTARYEQAYEEMQLFTPVKTLSDTDFVIIK